MATAPVTLMANGPGLVFLVAVRVIETETGVPVEQSFALVSVTLLVDIERCGRPPPPGMLTVRVSEPDRLKLQKLIDVVTGTPTERVPTSLGEAETQKLLLTAAEVTVTLNMLEMDCEPATAVTVTGYVPAAVHGWASAETTTDADAAVLVSDTEGLLKAVLGEDEVSVTLPMKPRLEVTVTTALFADPLNEPCGIVREPGLRVTKYGGMKAEPPVTVAIDSAVHIPIPVHSDIFGLSAPFGSLVGKNRDDVPG